MTIPFGQPGRRVRPEDLLDNKEISSNAII